MNVLIPFGEEIWIAEGKVVSFYGFPYSTRQAVIRLATGDLFVWSPVALTPGLATDVDALGTVAHIVSPNKIHHLFMGEWNKAYPKAKLYASPGLAKRRPGLAFDADFASMSQMPWAGEIDAVAMLGSLAMTEIVFFHHKSRTAIFADLIENFAPDWFKGWRGFLARLDGIVSPHPGAPREWRLSFCDRTSARAALARILAWQPERVIVAHGCVVPCDGGAFIRHSFRWLAS